MNFSKKEAAIWTGALIVAVGVIVVSWDWLSSHKPSGPAEVEVSPGQEAFGDSD